MRVIKPTRAFVARIDIGDSKKHRVRLVHQSVKEFILGELVPATSSTPTNSAQHPETPVECVEGTILNICPQYLLLNEINVTDLFSPEIFAVHELPPDVDLFDDDSHKQDYDFQCTWDKWEQDMFRYDPTERGFGEFFVYASCHWIDHFGAISPASLLPELDDIERVCQAGSKELANWTAQNQRPGCTIQARYPFDPDLHDPLSITAVWGSEAMLRRVLEQSDFSDHTRFRPESAFGAAEQLFVERGGLSRVRIIWESDVGAQIQSGQFMKLAGKQWSHRPLDRERSHWDAVFELMNEVLEEVASEGWAEVLVSLAVRTRCAPMVRVLKEAAENHPGLGLKLSSLRHSGGWNQP